MRLQCGQFRFDSDFPLIMGIVNLTPDSFSGDGLAGHVQRAIAHARRLIDEGADILDIGAESSRPGAEPTSESEELDRLLPVLSALAGCGVPISVDTYKPRVMQEAIAAGASLINDITGFRQPGAVEVVAASDCGVCVMHMQGEPLTMQQQPIYDDVLAEVSAFLSHRVDALSAAGVAAERMVLDPGFGFGKTLEHNVLLFKNLHRLSAFGRPLLVGVSRKTMLGAITGRAVQERQPASVAAAVLAVERGAGLVRVHDVAATKDALAVWRALRN